MIVAVLHCCNEPTESWRQCVKDQLEEMQRLDCERKDCVCTLIGQICSFFFDCNFNCSEQGSSYSLRGVRI